MRHLLPILLALALAAALPAAAAEPTLYLVFRIQADTDRIELPAGMTMDNAHLFDPEDTLADHALLFVPAPTGAETAPDPEAAP